MKKAAIILALLLGLAESTAWAHGTEQHVLGTVTAIQDGVLHVKTRTGETVSVETDAQTRYRRKGESATRSMPHVGDRVVIDIAKRSGALVATEVQFAGDQKSGAKK